MKNLKSNIILSTLVSAVALMATAANAAETNKLQEAYKSTNVKSALINVCKEETAKGKKLTSAEVSKYCTCAVEADGRLTNAQKWEIQSTINQKKSPATLAFVQKQNKDLQACFGPQLTGKLKSLTEEAMKSAQQKK
ncbi:hypothetical protein GCM10023345_10990 [Acinetobacter kookii]|uniref:Uncharacterized protein n=1 Tax=Acinetobacter kookii TaxID=1226327 RepID=A0A1G6H0T9_9GAMM|nr:MULTISPECIES: hypothetical protein [Acinetobacter]MCT8089718.1 hypothetical protein [Acinetobacter sp. F_3_1]MCT8098898.1 hypothetical protein [Acinetobacter sp. C_3_1]MCT8100844.1 hypothetical protein [Acinetobacter sp. C_4_1]MCT8134595.1 hypothetical protein [Acinetobacter sp. T_3_1]TCB71325.1 hypothetical protein E0H88_05525 [Acinetobacter sp. ANC 4216]